jgi:hypothetical protein
VVWFGARLGAIRYDGKVWSIARPPLAARRRMRAIAVAENGSAWFATSAGAGHRAAAHDLAAKAKF